MLNGGIVYIHANLTKEAANHRGAPRPLGRAEGVIAPLSENLACSRICRIVGRSSAMGAYAVRRLEFTCDGCNLIDHFTLPAGGGALAALMLDGWIAHRAVRYGVNSEPYEISADLCPRCRFVAFGYETASPCLNDDQSSSEPHDHHASEASRQSGPEALPVVGLVAGDSEIFECL